ncbi:LysR substrate-binding domain-containing protein [Leisingera sp. ANG-M1]|uniref:LysR substrate-binding domain-containing protein n=1 Tax=Leisingera sp. ANG-M1 TaxID=1577895 RepID=UPI00187C28E2|nr:LysR substrate-binding domain-containing protein [Leisingera sp. ANG-M1]
MIDLPSLNALRALAVLSETGSYALAARSLNVTPAAVSHQVKALEAHFSVALVTRQGRGVELTDEGRMLARQVRKGLAVLQDGVDQLNHRAEQQPVRITTSATFATYWLLPRLPDFQKRHPGIDVLINPSSDVVDIEHSDYDLAIRFCGQGGLPQGRDAFLDVSLNVFGTPALAQGCANDLQALSEQPWLQEIGTKSAEKWFLRKGYRPEHRLNVTEMPGNMVLRSLKQGLGVGVASCDWVREEAAEDSLVELWHSREHGHYYLVPKQVLKSRNAEVFMKWLLRSKGA